MKKLLTILCLVLLSVHSYSQEVVTENETVIRDGLFYHQLSTEPLTGIIEGFYKNGQLEYRANFRDGKQDGLSENFDEEGQLEIRLNYKDGKQDDLNEFFHENGQLEIRGNHKDGEKDGLQEIFDEDGNLISRYTIRNGVQVESETH